MLYVMRAPGSRPPATRERMDERRLLTLASDYHARVLPIRRPCRNPESCKRVFMRNGRLHGNSDDLSVLVGREPLIHPDPPLGSTEPAWRSVACRSLGCFYGPRSGSSRAAARRGTEVQPRAAVSLAPRALREPRGCRDRCGQCGSRGHSGSRGQPAGRRGHWDRRRFGVVRGLHVARCLSGVPDRELLPARGRLQVHAAVLRCLQLLAKL